MRGDFENVLENLAGVAADVDHGVFPPGPGSLDKVLESGSGERPESGGGNQVPGGDGVGKVDPEDVFMGKDLLQTRKVDRDSYWEKPQRQENLERLF